MTLWLARDGGRICDAICWDIGLLRGDGDSDGACVW